jgi:hypothetical protein
MIWQMAVALVLTGRGCSPKVDGQGRTVPPQIQAPAPREDAMPNPIAASSVKVDAIDPRLSPRDGGGWWFDVTWRFHNPTDQPLHLLAAGPQSVTSGRPIVIDETADDHAAVDGHITPEMAFVVIAPRSTFDHMRRYPLAPLPGAPPWQVVGRFAVSDVAPDPAWASGRAWAAIATWRQVLESTPAAATE